MAAYLAGRGKVNLGESNGVSGGVAAEYWGTFDVFEEEESLRLLLFFFGDPWRSIMSNR